MTYRWRITIEAWPHSTGHGAEADQKAAGDREHYYYVSAEDIGGAFEVAHCYAAGVCANPAVWKAPIMGVQRYDPEAKAAAGTREREKHIRTSALRGAAAVARDGCLVPPDGGSPSPEEIEMCDRIADAILRLV